MKIVGGLLFLCGLASAEAVLSQVGIGSGGLQPDNIPAPMSRLNFINGLARDSQGNIYVAEQTIIRRIDAATGLISTVAGNGTYSGVGLEEGPALEAQILRLGGRMAAAPDGTLLFTSSNCLKRFDPVTKTIKIVAGGCGSTSIFSRPQDVVVASNTTAYVSQGGFASHIRKVDLTSGTATLFAGAIGSTPSGDGGPALEAVLGNVLAIHLGPDGNLYLTDGPRVRMIDVTNGIISSVVGINAGINARALAANQAGDVYIGEPTGIRVFRRNSGVIERVAGTGQSSFNGDGPAFTTNLSVGNTMELAGNNIFFLDGANSRIRQLAGDTVRIITIAGLDANGDGGLFDLAVVGGAPSMVKDPGGNIFLASGNAIRRVDRVTNIITTFVGGGSDSSDGAVGKNASITPSRLAVDSQGTIFFVDGTRIRTVDAAARVTTIAGSQTSGYSGDGGPALQARFSLSLSGLAIDGKGNVVVADFGNCRVRQVNISTGIVTTIAGNGDCDGPTVEGNATQTPLSPLAIALGPEGDIYIGAKFGVWRLDSSGVLHPVAGNGLNDSLGDGGDAMHASFQLSAIGFDNQQNLLVMQTRTVRQVNKTTNTVQTVAGSGATGITPATGVPALAAVLDCLSILTDGDTLLVATQNGLFRVTPLAAPPLNQPPAISGVRSSTNIQTMTSVDAGKIISLAGHYLAPGAAWGVLDNSRRMATSLNGVRVLFNGVPGPIVYTSPAVVHAVVPYSFTSGTVTLETPNGESLAGFFPSSNGGVAIFPAPIFNPNGTINGPLNPARRGEVVTMFGTGMGPLQPAVADGTIIEGPNPPKPVRAIAARVAGPSGSNSIAAEVPYGGPAPGYVAGLAKLDVLIPANAPTGSVNLSAASGSIFGSPVAVYVTADPPTPVEPPTIKTVNPDIFYAGGVQTMSITGTGFEPGLYLQLYFNGVEDEKILGSAIGSVTSTSLTADIQFRATGRWGIAVVTPSGGRSAKVELVLPDRSLGIPIDKQRVRRR